MNSARLQPPPLPPLLSPKRLAVPDFQLVDCPGESDFPPVSSDDESEYYVLSNTYHNGTDDEEGEGYDSDLEYDNPFSDNNFQQLDESQRVDFPAVAPVKEEIKSNKDESEDYAFYENSVVDPPPVKEEIKSSKDESEVYVFFENYYCPYYKDDEEYYVILKSSDYASDREFDKPFWDSYYRQVYESKGFDIKDYPGPRPLPAFYALPRYLRDRKKYRMLKGYAETALKKYNDDKGTNHVIEEVLNVKRGACRDEVYNLIFSAKLGKGKKGYFHAMVVKDQEDNLDFPVVRPRVKRAKDKL